MKPLLIAAVASCSFWAGMAAATTLTGQVVDATVRHGIGSSAYESECQTYQNLGVAIGSGVEVGATNDTGGGCGGGIAADIDGTTNILTLTPADTGFGDYAWVEVVFSGFTIPITGVSLITNDLFTLAGFGNIIPDPQIVFTASSISILFDPAGSEIFDVTPVTGGVTSFQIETARAVPVPGTLPLMFGGLVALALARRRELRT